MIQICYCGNYRIFQGVLLSALSVVKNTDAAVEILLCTMDLSHLDESWQPFSAEQASLLESAVKERNRESRVRYIDMTQMYNEHFLDGKNQQNLYTPYAAIRLFLDLCDTDDKLVYLDTDVMCLGDIREYYDIDISDYELGATLDKMGHRWINPTYCNSGVLLLNMKRIRESGLFERCRNMIKNKKMAMPDQSAINKLAEDKLILPYRFNEQRRIKPDTFFKHFCKGFGVIKGVPRLYNYKPWQRELVHKYLEIFEFDDVFEMYDELIRSHNSVTE